jgi:hypothetical protein
VKSKIRLKASRCPFTTNFRRFTINSIEYSPLLEKMTTIEAILYNYSPGCGFIGRTLNMNGNEYQAAVAAFIRAKGVTRCPTACALPTQGTVPLADRAALADYAMARDHSREKRQAQTREREWQALAPAGEYRRA